MNNLKALREAKGLTQTELGAKIGVSQRHIAFLESGDRQPSFSLAVRLSSILGKNVEDIFLPIECTDSTAK